MDAFIVYLILFSIIVLIGQLFQKSTIPMALILVVFGMGLSFVPFMPTIQLDSTLVLNFFLPLLVYEISAFSSWRDMKKHFRPIALLSIGHVVFITIAVAVVIHFLIPEMGWPLAFVLGAIISPPDNVAIVAIAEKIRLPERIFLILEGEGMFNDAAALTLFRLALAAALTSQFSFSHAFISFFAIIIGETLYGLALGYLLGKIRSKIVNTQLHFIASFVTPFLAYIPAVVLGGTGIIATAVVGFIIGNQFTLRFTSEYRLASLTIWPTIAFAIQGIIFLLVGLNMNATITNIASVPFSLLLLYIGSLVFTVIIGRFIWVYAAVIFLPRVLFPSIRKKDPYPSWKYPFIISWSGIRGGVSLAAALAVPAFTLQVDHIDIRDLLIFFVFCIILVTLVIQGLSLPYILKKLGVDKIGRSERYSEHLAELQACAQMLDAALAWLKEYKKEIKHNKQSLAEVCHYINEYDNLKSEFDARILAHHPQAFHDEEIEIKGKLALLLQITDIQRDELTSLWREGKINLRIRNKLAAILDHQVQRHLI